MIEWNDIDTVFLDMDGTLLDLHYDNHFWLTHLPKRYSEIHQLEHEVAEKRLHQHIKDIEGTLDWYCLDYWSESLDLDIPALKRETKEKIKQRPHVTEFLSALRRKQKAIYLITNAHPAGIEIKLTQTNIACYFDEVISSHQFRFPKEDKAFWLALKKHLTFDVNKTLFIDDNIDVLNTAVNFGIKNILGIHQPDSQQQRILEAVPAIHHFDELLESLNLETSMDG